MGDTPTAEVVRCAFANHPDGCDCDLWLCNEPGDHAAHRWDFEGGDLYRCPGRPLTELQGGSDG